MHSMWDGQENINDLKHKLLCTNLELESVRMVAKEKIGKNEQTIKQLLHLLKIAYHERDEARDQFQRLINKFLISTEPDQIITNSTPIAYKFPTTLEESDNMSETLSQIYGLSPKECNSNVGVYSSSQGFPNMELSSIAIDNLIEGKSLPEKGKLQQAVFEAGPLLQTLLVAPPPQWRIPPSPLPSSLLRNPSDFWSNVGNFYSSKNYKKAACNKSCLDAMQSSSSSSSHLDKIPLNNGKPINGGRNSDFVKYTKSRRGVEECNNVRAVKKEFIGINKI